MKVLIRTNFFILSQMPGLTTLRLSHRRQQPATLHQPRFLLVEEGVVEVQELVEVVVEEVEELVPLVVGEQEALEGLEGLEELEELEELVVEDLAPLPFAQPSPLAHQF